VLVARKWSGKTLAAHRADRKNWLVERLGLSATDPTRYAWEPVNPGDRDHMPTARRLLHVVADRIRWRQALDDYASTWLSTPMIRKWRADLRDKGVSCRWRRKRIGCSAWS
jgi:hypothetical protein